ncbi:hypothetical protein BB427_13830 [Pseudoalteromonas sp. BMB]|uniref:tetratricopeptide repeat protein n=1 Tax=Pseudoalteromonas sp. BMB TaxID=1874619 RepID=UPI00083E1E2D|nr:tetratricopeptide repeat protein [Pseudoalteromonas sp. BMB]ODB37293.1 hypothetical protein BB427_13830 [Pseudoalteromonas sp. BMB]
MLDVQTYYEQGIAADKVAPGCEKAFDLFFKAARKKHADAQYMLGVLIAESNEEDKYEDAYDWWHKAAKQGHSKAQFNLGVCFSNGAGVEQDVPLAARWFEKAAEQQHSNAAFSLARLYYQGQNIEQSFTKAFQWMSRAAMLGHVNAMADVSLMCTMGQGIDKPNKIEGYAWAQTAESFGFDDTKRIIQSIEKVFTMSSAEKQQAKQLSDKFISRVKDSLSQNAQY